MSDNPFEEYKQKKKQHSQTQQPQSQEQRLQQELRTLPQGKELNNWICQQIANRIGDPVVWQYADTNKATQNRSNRVQFIDGSNNQTLQIIEVNRQEIARTRAMGQSWINQLMFAIKDDEGQSQGSVMHERMENDLSSRYEDMMDKITGGNDE